MKQSKAIQEALRKLPAVDEIIISGKINKYSLPHALIKKITQGTINSLRQEIINKNIPKNILDTIIKNVIQQLDQIIDFSIKGLSILNIFEAFL